MSLIHAKSKIIIEIFNQISIINLLGINILHVFPLILNVPQSNDKYLSNLYMAIISLSIIDATSDIEFTFCSKRI